MPAKKISALTETESLNDDLELPLYDPEGATPALKNRRARLATVIAWLIDGFSYLLNVAEDTSPQLGGPLDTNDHQIRESKGADVASASTLTLPADGNYYDITGTTAITAIATLGVGTMVTLHFDGILTLTHHATDLILPGGANITTAAGDEAIFREYAVGDWRCIAYTRASGLPLAESPAAGGIPTEVVYVDSTTLNLNQSHVGKMFAIYGDSSDAGVQIRTQAQSESDGHAWQAGAYFWAFGEGGSNTERILEPSSNTLYNNGALGNITLTGGKVHLVYRQMSGTWRVIAAS